MTTEEVFVGALGNFLGGLATNFVAGMLQASSRRIAARFQPDPVQRALLTVTEDAMLVAFSNIEANTDLIDHYRSILETFFQSEPVQDELSKLLDPHPSNTPDTNLLYDEFIKAGYESEILPGLDFNLFISDFIHGFYIAVSKHEEFQGIIQIRLLQQQADAMISMVSLTSAISKSSSETALNVREIRRLLETQHDIPQIAVGFLGESKSMETELIIVLEETASEPDYDAIIEKKRRVLEKRGEEERAISSSILRGMLNPNNDEEVEEYLKNYRRHLEGVHEYDSLRGAVRWITPVFENQGSRPASNVRIEFEMPKGFVNPTKDMEFRALLATRPPDSYLTPPTEPELVRNIEDLMGMRDNLSWLTMPLDPGGPVLVEPSDPNAIEVEFLDSGGAISIVYNIPRLIQRRPTNGPEILLWLREFAESAKWRIRVRVDAEEFQEMVGQALYIDIVLA